MLGTPVPTDCSTGVGRPSAVRPIVNPPRGLIAVSREGKNPFEIFKSLYIYIVIIIENDGSTVVQMTYI